MKHPPVRTTSAPDTWLTEQRRAANALVRFCEQHQYTGPHHNKVLLCRDSLNAGNILAAVTAYKNVPLGGNGCFNDWWPRSSDAGSFEYELATFQALVERWSRLMSLSVSASAP